MKYEIRDVISCSLNEFRRFEYLMPKVCWVYSTRIIRRESHEAWSRGHL